MQRSAMKAPRQKKCAVCRENFTPWNSLVKVCGVTCSLAHVELQRRKINRKARINYNKANETKGDLTKKAQREFNAFIRLRDHDKPCISCGEFNPGGDARGGKWDCGHYRSVGSAPELRFEEINAHRQCKRCNSYLGGNVVEYRKGLELRIGTESLAWLEGNHELPQRTHAELRDIAEHYKAATKQLKKLLEQPL